MGPTWGPPGTCRPQMGPMLAPWTLLSGTALVDISQQIGTCRFGSECHLPSTIFKRCINLTQIAKFIGPTWGPTGSCRPQMSTMLEGMAVTVWFMAFVCFQIVVVFRWFKTNDKINEREYPCPCAFYWLLPYRVLAYKPLSLSYYHKPQYSLACFTWRSNKNIKNILPL